MFRGLEILGTRPVTEHVNLAGDDVGGATEKMTENPDVFRPLRMFSKSAALSV